MTAERWEQIERLYHSALGIEADKRASYLDQACAGDANLRREVASLLSNSTVSGGFLESPALEHVAREYASAFQPDFLGKTLGRYEVSAYLGAGGMGKVYRAHDLRLNREVALKVLAPESMGPGGSKRRFEREARAASGLNHPNIVTVYDIDTINGIDFIAMEYVPGKTLSELIAGNALPLEKALRYAVQIAGALAAAHGAGIVHRDLKPANIRVNTLEQVKVLDFGLAKRTGRADGEEQGSSQTGTGTILGTAAYMSPEQAEGKKVDARSDIFSFGVTLYEMVTGRQPFHRDSWASTLAAILTEEPGPASERIRRLPPELDRILSRCLRKDPERRFQHMDDITLALQDLHAESTGARLRRKRRVIALAGAFAALVALTLAAAYLFSEPARPEPVIVPLTSYPGREYSPSFSPDGNQVAFVWNGPVQDNHDVYVKEVGTENLLRLTSDPTWEGSPAWSPDGRRIAFLRDLSGGHFGVFLKSPLGGPERKAGEVRWRPLVDPTDEPMENPPSITWSPDGTWLVLAGIWGLSVETGEKRKLTPLPPGFWGAYAGGLSPDGRTLVYAAQPSSWHGELYVLPLRDDLSPTGKTRQLTFQRRLVESPAWTADSREVVYSSRSGSSRGMWRTPVAGTRAPSRVAFAGDQVGGIAISRQGNRMAYERVVTDRNIWRLELRSPGIKAGEPVSLISSTWFDTVGRYSPDGARIAFISGRSGHNEVWTCKSDGTEPVQLTFMQAQETGDPSWSPDGKRIKFDANPNLNWDVYDIDAQHGKPRRLTYHPAIDALGSFSRDGLSIYFRSDRSGDARIWKVPAQGGEPIQVSGAAGFEPQQSLDGKYLYYTKSTSLWRIPTAGGREEKIADDVSWMTFALSATGVYFIRPGARRESDSIMFFDSSTKKTGTVARTPQPAWLGLSVSPDERYLLYTQIDQEGSDLMLVENFR